MKKLLLLSIALLAISGLFAQAILFPTSGGGSQTQTIDNATPNATTVTVQDGVNATLTINRTIPYTISEAITTIGSGTLTINLIGTAIVNMTDPTLTFNGMVNVNDGQLVVPNGGFPNATVTVINGKTLNFSAATTVRDVKQLVLNPGAVLQVITGANLNITERLRYGAAPTPANLSGVSVGGIRFASGATLEYFSTTTNSASFNVGTKEWVTVPTERPTNVQITGPGSGGPFIVNLTQSRTIPGVFLFQTDNVRFNLPEKSADGSSDQRLTLNGPVEYGFTPSASTNVLRGSRRAQLTLSGNATSTLYFDQLSANRNHLYDFRIANGYNISLGNRLNITDGIGQGGEEDVDRFRAEGCGLITLDGSALNTNDNLYFLSTRNGTGLIGRVVTSTVTGNFYADLYFRPGAVKETNADGRIGYNEDVRKWRFISFPNLGERTIRQTIVGNGTSTAISPVTSAAAFTGITSPTQDGVFGTLVTGHNYSTDLGPNNAAAAGYDSWPQISGVGTSSIRRYTWNGSSWGFRSADSRVPVSPAPPFIGSGTIIDQTLNNKENGYMLFVRGDRRSITGLSNVFGDSNVAIIRSFGTFQDVPKNFPIAPRPTSTSADRYYAFGNPFQSNFRVESILTAGSGLPLDNLVYHIWDTDLGLYGNWRTITKSGSEWLVGLSPVTNGGQIRPGQAIILERVTGSAGTYVLNDDAKADLGQERNFQTEYRVFDNTVSISGLAINFFMTLPESKQKRGIQEAVVFFDNGRYDENKVENGILRLQNNFSSLGLGLLRNGITYSVENRPDLKATDTIYLRTTGMSAGEYSFSIHPSNIAGNGMELFIVDEFLNTRTPLSTETKTDIDFEVTSDVASASATRFRLEFVPSSTLPVTFTDISVVEKSGDASVNWSTATERGVRHFEVEYSPNGRDFARVGTVAAQNTATAQYNYLHSGIGEGKHFYRVRSVDLDGKTALTRVVNVEIGKGIEGFGVYPTVITEGSVTLRLNSLPKGRYNVQVTDMSGKVMMAAPLQHNGGTANQTMRLPAMSNGAYNVRLQGDNGQTYIQRVMKQ